MRSKKLFLIVLIGLLYLIPVKAEESVIIDNLKVIKSSDGVVLNANDKVDAAFNDLNQQVKYEVTIKNPTSKKLYLNFLEVENKSEKFMEYKLDSKSENMVLEPNESSKAIFYINTLEIEGAGRNLDDNVKINFIVSDKIFNPNTFSNIFDLIILLLVLGSTMYFIRKNKKVKTFILIVGISVISINYVSANDYIKAQLSGNIKYTSQNNIITTGTTLNNKKADYTNSKEVWAYYDKVKNVEVKSLLNEPKKYYKKFDLTENKTGRVMAYLTENNDKDTPYDLTIMSQGVIIANPDASFMFSFPKTEKVEGLSNVDFSETTTMQGMFIGNEKLEKIDTEAIELKSTIDTSYMFYDCEEIEHGRSDFNLENVTNTTMMFTPYLFNEVKDGAKVETDKLFAKSPSETNLRGNFIRKDTLEDEHPIYYYRGAVTNNNVKFAGFCWQIVRTTETGGVKLVYNGTPNTDGTCKGPGEDISIGMSVFNSPKNTISNVGYMYGDKYQHKVKETTSSISTEYESKAMSKVTDEYFYSKSYEYKDGKYILKNAVKKNWKEAYNELEEFYTCLNTDDTSCDTMRYIIDTNVYTMYSYKYTNGELPDDKFMVIGKKYKEKENGEYELLETESLSKQEFRKKYKQISEDKYYICNELQKTTCNDLKIIVASTQFILSVESPNIVVYGNDVEYKDGEYILKNTYTVDNYVKNINEISNKYHYTCFNNTGKCTDVNYIINSTQIYSISYLTFSNGITLDSFKQKIFENKNDSEIKKVIDNWYANNLINYKEYLEDTIWCNDRKIVKGSLISESSSSETNICFNANNRLIDVSIPNPSLKCEQLNDSFTVSKDNGNGALTYPIGMLTSDEVMLSGFGYSTKNYSGESYLASDKTTKAFYTMTPENINMSLIVISQYDKSGLSHTSIDATSNSQVRPAVSLKNKIKYTSGNGTKENPYVIE